MKHKPPIFYAVYKGELFLKMRYSGIHFLVVCSDGISISRFKGDKETYLKAQDVLDWYKKELEYAQSYPAATREKYKKMIQILEQEIAKPIEEGLIDD